MLEIPSEMILLRAGKFRHLEDGVIVGWPTPIDMNLADAKELIELFWRLEPGGKFRILIDQRGVSRKLEAPAREHLERGHGQQPIATAGSDDQPAFRHELLERLRRGRRDRASWVDWGLYSHKSSAAVLQFRNLAQRFVGGVSPG